MQTEVLLHKACSNAAEIIFPEEALYFEEIWSAYVDIRKRSRTASSQSGEVIGLDESAYLGAISGDAVAAFYSLFSVIDSALADFASSQAEPTLKSIEHTLNRYAEKLRMEPWLRRLVRMHIPGILHTVLSGGVELPQETLRTENVIDEDGESLWVHSHHYKGEADTDAVEKFLESHEYDIIMDERVPMCWVRKSDGTKRRLGVAGPQWELLKQFLLSVGGCCTYQAIEQDVYGGEYVPNNTIHALKKRLMEKLPSMFEDSVVGDEAGYLIDPERRLRFLLVY
ncbi:MAG: hypothetical protein ABII79_05600 [bacterium]